MKGLIAEEEIKVGEVPLPWKRSETDKLLDLYFGGAHPTRIAVVLHRSPKSVRMRLEKITYDEEDRATNYRPFKRISRKGQRITVNEQVIIDAHRKRKIPAEVTAQVLMREVEEIAPAPTKVPQVRAMKVFAPTLDLILALRYIFHVYHKSLVTDKEYDGLVQEEIEYGGAGKVFFGKVSDPKSCPRRIKSLALYLCDKFEDDKNGTAPSPRR